MSIFHHSQQLLLLQSLPWLFHLLPPCHSSHSFQTSLFIPLCLSHPPSSSSPLPSCPYMFFSPNFLPLHFFLSKSLLHYSPLSLLLFLRGLSAISYPCFSLFSFPQNKTWNSLLLLHSPPPSSSLPLSLLSNLKSLPLLAFFLSLSPSLSPCPLSPARG